VALLSGIVGVRVAEPGELLLDDGTQVADVVAALVHGEVRVSAVEPRRRNLEQVYLEMSHASGPQLLT
jgi:hypothetical protein